MTRRLYTRRFKGSEEDRFFAKVHFKPGCWPWLAGGDGHGYGVFIAGGRKVKAHRYAYTWYVGPIPEGMQLDHLCRNPRCVNPDHLEPVTHRENGLRGIGAPAVNARKTHCRWGHEFTPENTYLRPGQRYGRDCLTCIRARTARISREAREARDFSEPPRSVDVAGGVL